MCRRGCRSATLPRSPRTPADRPPHIPPVEPQGPFCTRTIAHRGASCNSRIVLVLTARSPAGTSQPTSCITSRGEFAVPTIVFTGDKPATVIPIQRAAARCMAARQHHRRIASGAPDLAPPPADDPTDAELITDVRAGRLNAYGVLYGRHRNAAGNLARQLARTDIEA